MSNVWDAGGYRKNAAFVSDLGDAVLELLAPRKGERILDLGCGDGALAESIASMGASVVGVDSSPSMVDAARVRDIDARLGSATELTFENEFDAVFSNAVLHWIPDAGAVLDGVARALRPGGRFVAELGGFGNIAAIRVAQRLVLENRGIDLDSISPQFFPTPREYQGLLDRQGFSVSSIELIPRPTPLPQGMRSWLETFSRGVMNRIADPESYLDETVRALEPSLRDTEGNWIADYVRLRFSAVKAS